MGIRLGSTRITIPGLAKIMHGDTLIYSSAPAGPVNYTLTQKSVLEHDANKGFYSSICKIDDTHFAVAYNSSGTDGGVIKTFSIDPNNNFAITEVDRLVHLSLTASFNSLILIDSTHLMLAYREASSSGDGFIKTFSIDANCDNITEIDSWEYDTNRSEYNSLVKINDTKFAVVYSGPDGDGFIKTFSIDANCDNITQIASREYDTSNGAACRACLFDSTHIIIIYTDTSFAGKVIGISFDENADNLTVLYSVSIGTISLYNSICKIDDSHVAAAFTDSSTEDGFIKIIAVNESYQLSVVATYEFDESAAFGSDIMIIDPTHLFLVYSQVYNNGDGIIKTLSIDESYAVAEVDSLTHEDGTAYGHSACLLDELRIAVAYTGLDGYGYIKVFELD